MIAHVDPAAPVARENAIYRDALLCCRLLGNEELGALRDALAYEHADLDALYGDAPPAALLVGERLRAASDEWERRRRLHAGGRTVPNPGAVRYDAWRRCAREVRERAHILAVFAQGGHHLSRAGAGEWAGACLACAGRDRFRVFLGPPGRYWCRRCHLTGDAITAARNVLGLDFFAAVALLARETGVPVPVEYGPAPTRARAREGSVRLA